tara:strand:+ start:990 stop:1997 length:1008 start_codon:yes stop_codon:yes gene_type:complete
VLDNYITDHGVVLPDPAVSFDDEGYKPTNNDYPQIYDTLLRALQESNINLFSMGVNDLYNQLEPSPILKKQLQAALSGFALLQASKTINYKGPNKFSELGCYETIINTDELVDSLEKDIVKLKETQPTRDTRFQDRIIRLPFDHEVYNILNTIYNDLKLLPKPYLITDVNLHISDKDDTFNEYFQTDQKHKPKNDLYTLHIDPKYSYIKTMIYLNTVQRGNGPFAYIPKSHRWKFDDVEMLFCKSNQLSNTLATPEQRAVNAKLPLWARKNSYFSRQFKNNTQQSDFLTNKLKHFTSDESNFILFEPNFGWHRGTHVDTGERIALQVILKPQGDK